MGPPASTRVVVGDVCQVVCDERDFWLSHRKHLRVKGWLAGVDLIMSENIEIHENGNGVTNPGFHPDNEDEKKVLTSSLILLYYC